MAINFDLNYIDAQGPIPIKDQRIFRPSTGSTSADHSPSATDPLDSMTCIMTGPRHRQQPTNERDRDRDSLVGSKKKKEIVEISLGG